MSAGNASYDRWLCLNFMLLCCSFLDVTLLLQQKLLAVFTAPQTYFHWQQAWTNVARESFCYSKEELCYTRDRYGVYGGFLLLLPKCLCVTWARLRLEYLGYSISHMAAKLPL